LNVPVFVLFIAIQPLKTLSATILLVFTVDIYIF
jgi:hypothetical protein